MMRAEVGGGLPGRTEGVSNAGGGRGACAPETTRAEEVDAGVGNAAAYPTAAAATKRAKRRIGEAWVRLV